MNFRAVWYQESTQYKRSFYSDSFWVTVGLCLLSMAVYGLFTPVKQVYMHKIIPSEQRATVLSFKGLAFNFAYGLIGILYSLVLAVERGRLDKQTLVPGGFSLDDAVFIRSLQWFPWYFLVLIVIFCWFGRRTLSKRAN